MTLRHRWRWRNSKFARQLLRGKMAMPDDRLSYELKTERPASSLMLIDARQRDAVPHPQLDADQMPSKYMCSVLTPVDQHG